ncbi:MAG: FkbM family methyltransferase [Aeromicrobium sp.]|nr:FkbM family methyltransferase [Aeromicrobium sp.]
MSGHTSDVIQRFIYAFGAWEPNLSRWVVSHLRPGDVVLDCGANVGYFSMLAASKVGDTGKVIAFEPVPLFAETVKAQADRNGFANVEVRQQAVSDEPGTVDLYVAGGRNLGESSTEELPGYSSKIAVDRVRVEDVIATSLWPAIRWVKVDVEGDELRALRGMSKLLASLGRGAAVTIELAPNRLTARGQSAGEAMAFMTTLGFVAWTIPNDYAARHYAFASLSDQNACTTSRPRSSTSYSLRNDREP